MHGPVPRELQLELPAADAPNAIKSALAQKLRDGKIVCVDGFALSTPKTRDLEGLLSGKLGVTRKACCSRSTRNRSRLGTPKPRLKVRARAVAGSPIEICSASSGSSRASG